jgi:hypothetical protein
MVQVLSGQVENGSSNIGQPLTVQSLKEIKKSRRTVILGAGLNLPAGGDGVAQPLTPPLSERASDDVEELFSPEQEEHYESLELSSDDEELEEEDDEWNHHDQQPIHVIDDPEQVPTTPSLLTWQILTVGRL